MDSDSFREVRCGLCQRIFHLCPDDDDGQVYCPKPAPCSAEARHRSVRAARAKHQKSKEGREDHRDRMRAYRAEKRPWTIVVDQSDQDEREANVVAKPPAGSMSGVGETRTRAEGVGEGEVSFGECISVTDQAGQKVAHAAKVIAVRGRC